ncbi:MAG: hypothetical protein HN826_13390 [Methylococcales bacterium]|jgi:hypothetical protein|nr:hypothetical protein [Methylococcales bacterium]
MGIFSSIFGKDEEEHVPRSLDHPRDLAKGDIVKFGFSAQTEISNQSFQITNVCTYDLGGEHKQKMVFSLDESNDTRLSVIKERGEERLELSKIIFPEMVAEIFKINKFARIFDEDSGTNNKLKRQDEPKDVANWTTEVYRQEAGHQAYFADGDKRDVANFNDADGWEEFDYFLLVSDDRNYALQAEVYDGGRTDVYLITYLPIEKIEELWPAKQ